MFISCWEVAEEAFEEPGLPMQFCWMPGKAVILCVVLEKASFSLDIWGCLMLQWFSDVLSMHILWVRITYLCLVVLDCH